MKYCPKCQRSYAAFQSLCPDDGEALALKDLYGLVGRVINDKYRIESLVTVGGMSAVYRARQIGVERNVAFKILLPHLALNNQDLHMLFEREARTAGRLTHENIATVHDAGRTGDEISYIVMEWLEGKTLETELQETAQFSFQRIAYLLRQITAALDAAHAHGVIHRDLKPSNIMIVKRRDGRDQVKVLDFGLAKITNESTDLEVSSALGTPHYASPEQFRIGEEISGRSDIYSLGVILYRLLTSQMPFEAASVHELIRLHLLESPAPLRSLRPDAPPEIEYLVTRMLAKTPHYRPATGAEVVEAFEQASQQQPSLALNGDSPAPKLANGGAGHPANGQSNGHIHPLPPAGFTGSLSFSQASVRGLRVTSALPNEISDQPVVVPVAPPASNHEEKTPESPNGNSGNHNHAAAQAAHTRGATFVSVNPGGTQNLSKPAPPVPTQPRKSPEAVTQPKAAPLIQMQVDDPRKLILWLIAAALIGGAVFYFFYNRQPQLTSKDTVLVADFANLTGDETFDKTLKPALALQLAQSPFLNLLSDEQVRETLRFMNRPPDEPITHEIAREICLRRGLKAMFTGQIDQLEHSYAIALEALNAQTGAPLARTMLQAADKDQILKTLGAAALKLREQLGESLSSMQKFNTPIELATTSSLAALTAYSLGNEQLNLKANATEAIPLYQRAIELDPNFAMPHYALALIYTNQGRPRLSVEYCARAFKLRARASERERLMISALYHSVVTGDVQQASETYKLLIQTYPNDAQPHTGLANLYRQTGQLNQALAEAELASQLNSNEVAPHLLRATTLLRLNRFDEAKQKLEQALAQKVDNLGLRAALFQLAFLHGNQALMNQQLAWAREQRYDEQALDWQAQAAAASGRVREAASLWRQAINLSQQRGAKEFSAPYAISAALSYALSGLPHQARQLLDEAMALAPDNFAYYSALSSLPFGPLTYALCGARDKAQTLSAELTQNQPQNALANNVWLPVTKALLAVQANQPEQALDALKYLNQYESCAQYYANWVRGQAQMQLKRGYDAKVEFQKILSKRGLDTLSLLYPLAHLSAARAAALIGDLEESRKHYKDFLAAWQSGDADLPVLAAAKKEFAAL